MGRVESLALGYAICLLAANPAEGIQMAQKALPLSSELTQMTNTTLLPPERASDFGYVMIFIARDGDLATLLRDIASRLYHFGNLHDLVISRDDNDWVATLYYSPEGENTQY